MIYATRVKDGSHYFTIVMPRSIRNVATKELYKITGHTLVPEGIKLYTETGHILIKGVHDIADLNESTLAKEGFKIYFPSMDDVTKKWPVEQQKQCVTHTIVTRAQATLLRRDRNAKIEHDKRKGAEGSASRTGPIGTGGNKRNPR